MDATSQYEVLEKVGEGTYGVVYKARDKETGQIVALKKIRLDVEDQGVPSTTLREVALLRELEHANVVRLLDVVQRKKRLFLIFEFVTCDLKQYLDSTKENLDPMLIKSYVYQTIAAIHYCHTHRVVHRDIKPANLLIDKDGTLKLADFGLARVFGIPFRVYTHQVVTLWYRAPEILLGQKIYACPVDIWSIGCIFAELIMRRPLFPGDSEIDELFQIFKVLGTPTEETWPEVSKLPDYKATFPKWSPKALQSVIPTKDPLALDLLQSMLQYQPQKRITAANALAHPYFKDLLERLRAN